MSRREKDYAEAIDWLFKWGGFEKESIRSAAERISERFDISPGAAFHLVRDFRNGSLFDGGGESAGSGAGREESTEDDDGDYQPDEPELIPIHTPSPHNAYYRPDDDQYVFSFALTRSRKHKTSVHTFDMPAEQVQYAIEQYVYAGRGQTQKQVCRLLFATYGREMTADYFKYFLAALGIDKNSTPIAPHRFEEESTEELAHSWREKEEALVEIAKRNGDADYWKKRAMELKSKLVDIKMFMEHLPPVNITINHDLDPPEQKNYNRCPLQPLFMFSDWHIGANVAVEEAVDSIIGQLKSELSLFNFRCAGRPQIILAGDMLDGVMGNMHPEQGRWQNRRGAEQVVAYKAWMTHAIRTIANYFDEMVDVHSVHGNHDRVGAHRSEDPSRVLHEICCEWIQDVNKDVCQFHIPYTGNAIHTSELAYGTELILYHGDNQPKDWRRTLLANMDRSKEHHLLVSGHLHSPEVRIAEDLNVMVYRVGSPKAGSDVYAKEVIGAGCRPSQQILFVGPRGPKIAGQVLA